MDEHKKFKKYAKRIATGAAIVGGIALAPIAIGFGSAGIAAGSIAAGIQSLIGNVAAGSFFATMTSFGMTGVFTTTAATSGASACAAGASTKFFFHDPQKDAETISKIINNRENPEKIVELIQFRKPIEREVIRFAYNNLGVNRNFDREVINYIPQNQNEHIQNLIQQTDNILVLTPQINNYLMNQPFSKHFMRDFSYVIDARLINNVILFNDNPSIIIRLIEYRSDDERVKIDKEFRKIREDRDRRMLLYIIDYIGNDHPDVPYLYALLEDTE